MNFYSVFILSQLAIFPFLFAIIKSKYSNEINKLNIFFVVSYITECITTILIKAKLYDYSSIPGNLYILISSKSYSSKFIWQYVILAFLKCSL